MNCVDVTLRFIGPAFVCFAITLISGVIWTWFTFIIDRLAEPGTLLRYVHLCVAITLIFNVFFNYLYTVLTPPGKTPEDYEHPPPDPEARLQDAKEQFYAQALKYFGISEELKDPNAGFFPDGFGRFCKKCRRPKPQRTHHCSICRNCILKMDHHCPWVAQCVGYRNYRTFFLFMFWLWMGCLYIMATMGPSFLQLVKQRPHTEDHTPIVFSCVLALSVAIAVGVLLTWHVYLLCTGQTTIEWYNNRMRAAEARKRGHVYHNPWDLGVVNNMAMVLGTRNAPHNWVWWIWPTLSPPPGNGLEYGMRRDFFYKMVPTAESELASSGGRLHVHPKTGELEMEAVGKNESATISASSGNMERDAAHVE